MAIGALLAYKYIEKPRGWWDALKFGLAVFVSGIILAKFGLEGIFFSLLTVYALARWLFKSKRPFAITFVTLIISLIINMLIIILGLTILGSLLLGSIN